MGSHSHRHSLAEGGSWFVVLAVRAGSREPGLREVLVSALRLRSLTEESGARSARFFSSCPVSRAWNPISSLHQNR